MDTLRSILRPLLAGFFLVLIATRASAIVFTSNQSIGPLDTAFDGADIVISNCTVTMDGAHSFNSLLVTNGGVLTHSFFPGGSATLVFNVTNEPQFLTGTNPVALLQSNVTVVLSVTDSGGTVIYTNGVDYMLANPGDGTTQIYRTETSAIPDGATVLVNYTWSYVVAAGLVVTVSNDVTIASGGSIIANGNGYGGGQGAGHGFSSFISPYSGSGAGHGGYGGYTTNGANVGSCYGSLYQPVTLGSGGGQSYAGSGGSGGGRIQIAAGGNISIDGLISATGADATNSRAGGGAGGSIWLTATNITGSGSLSVNGGAGEPVYGGGGGGGQISLQCSTNYFTGNVTAYGGTGWQAGGAGTIFVQTNDQPGLLLVDNGTRNGATSLVNLGTSADVMISGGARVQPGGTFSPRNLTIATNGALIGSYQTLLDFTVTGDLTIQSGGGLTLDSLGYDPLTVSGPGAGGYYSGGGSPYPCGGGGHGGYGAAGSVANASGGNAYGSQTSPTTFGGNGGKFFSGPAYSLGGNGGGAVQLTVTGILRVDGRISANGGDGYGTGGGGGAGGSVNLTCGTLSGTGSITANGGNGVANYGGGGGGGRIAVVCGLSTFTGTMLAAGGGGANWGGAGTIYLQQSSPQPPYRLILDNAGHVGTNTPLATLPQADLIIRNGAVGTVASFGLSFASLSIDSNAWLTTGFVTSSGWNLTIAGNATIKTGGGITADLAGYPAGQGYGSGAGKSGNNPYYPCSGGGHGGGGGNAATNSAVGGSTYDYAVLPNYSGSGGGSYSSLSFGGSGGGIIFLTITGILQLDGTISANGGNGAGQGGGGGAGGSLNLNLNTLAGNGSITANGGNGVNGMGGGGGGGCVAIQFNTNSLMGAITACGGGGANYGGAGTVYLKNKLTGQSAFFMDNAGHNGAGSLTPNYSSADLTISGGAFLPISSAISVANLVVNSNAWINFGSGSISASGNITVQPGGMISADGSGSAPNSGSGAGHYYSFFPYDCSGAGHGGTGGRSFEGAVSGGATYDSAASTSIQAGSGGGGYAIYSIGGYGGGVIQLTAGGTLQVDGRISANGANGYGSGGGGGSGGGVILNAGVLAGNGTISANGGDGAYAIGGGGGGGRIAILFNTNLFGGNITAYGGGGASFGGAGTYFLKPNASSTGTVVVDNANHNGADSSVQSSSSINLTVQNGGLLFASGSYSFANLLVNTNGSFLVSTTSLPATLSLTAGNITVQPGGAISGDATGYRAGFGYGYGAGGYYSSPPNYPCGGGGHAGYGASSAYYLTPNGGVGGYDTVNSPTYAGSGGGNGASSIGGNGGAVIQMTVAGKLRVDGSLSVNGGNGSGTGGGGGAGGSLNLNLGGLAGGGFISANGGNGVSTNGGGGGGGVVALTLTSNLFSGTISAYGGGGANYGGAGAIYFKTNSINLSVVMLDNAGNHGTNTGIAGVPSASLLNIRNGTVAVQTSSSQTLAGLLISSNAWLIPGSNPGVMNLTVNGLATIQSGGGILADALGYAQNTGTGHGSYSPPSPWFPCSGAGHGGYGAGSSSNSSPGGITYDSTTAPTTSGSGGGGYGTYSFGGAGGGFINLHVNGALQLDGLISANGGDGYGTGGGGGSGGGIILYMTSLAGGGGITANGGAGALDIGGGGGGGRIAINFTGYNITNSFTGTVAAYGGGGGNFGGAGTVYYAPYLTNGPLLVLDNNNHAGTNTSFDFSTMDVIIQNQARGLLPVSGSWSPHNLLIRTNGILTAPASAGSRQLSANNLTIDEGGALSLDGVGYAQGAGTGVGSSSSSFRGGGGHGGYGGMNSVNFGRAYDSIQMPASAGSGGGAYNSGPPYSYGGNGGGALQLTVSDTLTVNGRLSANGGDGGLNAGGGSGGSLYLPSISKLAGSGIISANGGSAGGYAGGGGGGRIALVCNTNNFNGQITAFGGNGFFPGGAGTIYSVINGVKTLQVDNGGITGTNTPLGASFSMPNPPFDLNLAGAAVVVPVTPLPLLDNLTIAAGATLTAPGSQSNLVLAVQNNANLAGSLTVDYLGYLQANGPGAGTNIASKGSGGGYGGNGGDSASGATGGITYGSATQPVDFGSGGGSGYNTITGGSTGGGALRLSVGGTLNVDGNISANGSPGWQDDSGGGAGGSVWITAQSLSGNGNVSAAGGNGDLFGGGGGGGGRIAIYAPTNLFVGTTNATGGYGAWPGADGTIILSSAFEDFQVSAQSPAGIVSNTVSYVDLNFNEAIDAASISSSTFTLVTPAGPLPGASLNATSIGLATMRVSFPVQNLPGEYSVTAATTITNFFSQPLAEPYIGNFTIALPTISGTVSDTNGAPVAGVTMQPDGGLTGTLTDGAGNYAIGVPPGWNGTVTPASGSFMFIPGSLVFTNVTGSLTNQNFLTVPTIAPAIVSSLNGTNLALAWTGYSGVNYQTWSSTNLVDWLPYGDVIPGTNGPMQFELPLDASPSVFFRLGASQ